jgi:hypothetical protein
MRWKMKNVACDMRENVACCYHVVWRAQHVVWGNVIAHVFFVLNWPQISPVYRHSAGSFFFTKNSHALHEADVMTFNLVSVCNKAAVHSSGKIMSYHDDDFSAISLEFLERIFLFLAITTIFICDMLSTLLRFTRRRISCDELWRNLLFALLRWKLKMCDMGLFRGKILLDIFQGQTIIFT